MSSAKLPNSIYQHLSPQANITPNSVFSHPQTLLLYTPSIYLGMAEITPDIIQWLVADKKVKQRYLFLY